MKTLAIKRKAPLLYALLGVLLVLTLTGFVQLLTPAAALEQVFYH